MEYGIFSFWRRAQIVAVTMTQDNKVEIVSGAQVRDKLRGFL
jgi:hypothetical protein